LDGVVVPIVEIVKETVDAVPRSVQRAVVEGASSLAALDVVSHPHPVGIAPLLIVIIPVGTGVGVLVGGTGVGGTGTLKEIKSEVEHDVEGEQLAAPPFTEHSGLPVHFKLSFISELTPTTYLPG
jgi:hypothetical protein